jgi:alanine dehydrogenase
MRIGIPREVKDNEYRVAITPAGVQELVAHGHTVSVERDAGAGSSILDEGVHRRRRRCRHVA